MAGEFPFNGKFVASSPQCLGLGSKKDPHQPLRFGAEGVKNRKPVYSRLRVPIHAEQISHPTPQKTRQRALKENVVHGFDLSTQGAQPVRVASTRLNLLIGREMPSR
jgi:hypothetical protein